VADRDGRTGLPTWDVFSEEELGQLRGFPEIGPGELVMYFTVAPVVSGCGIVVLLRGWPGGHPAEGKSSCARGPKHY
jgi:hypothetical protein